MDQAGMSGIFRLAQVTDVHLGPLPRMTREFINLKRAAGMINWYRSRRHVHVQAIADAIVRDAWAQGADHVAVTGDLCNIGLPAEYIAALKWLETVGAPDKVSVIPGNHDIYSSLGRDPGVERWAAYMASCAAGQALAVQLAVQGETFPLVRVFEAQGFRVALIGLNSAMETPPLIAAGQLGAGQTDRLQRILRATREAGMVRLVMIHHPPLPGQAKADRGLRDAERLRDILVAEGADLVIHGHNHAVMFAGVDGVNGYVPVIGAPSASAAVSHKGEPLARSHIFEVTATGGRPRIRLISRGITGAGGGIATLDDRMVSPL